MNVGKGSNLDRSWALLFARLVLGLIFFMAGVYKVFQLGALEHARKYFLPYADTFLPVWSLWAMIPRLALLLFILLLPREDDRFSLDYLLLFRKNKRVMAGTDDGSGLRAHRSLSAGCNWKGQHDHDSLIRR